MKKQLLTLFAVALFSLSPQDTNAQNPGISGLMGVCFENCDDVTHPLWGTHTISWYAREIDAWLYDVFFE